MNTQDKIANLEILLAAVQAQPEALFDLGQYQRKEPCGTLFCTVGLATTLPHFQQLGFHMAQEKLSYSTGLFTGVKVGPEWIFDTGVASVYFGPDAFDNLFTPAGSGDIDSMLGYVVEYNEDDDTYAASMTDKELAIARLMHQLETMKEQA